MITICIEKILVGEKKYAIGIRVMSLSRMAVPVLHWSYLTKVIALVVLNAKIWVWLVMNMVLSTSFAGTITK